MGGVCHTQATQLVPEAPEIQCRGLLEWSGAGFGVFCPPWLHPAHPHGQTLALTTQGVQEGGEAVGFLGRSSLVQPTGTARGQQPQGGREREGGREQGQGALLQALRTTGRGGAQGQVKGGCCVVKLFDWCVWSEHVAAHHNHHSHFWASWPTNIGLSLNHKLIRHQGPSLSLYSLDCSIKPSAA